MSRNMKFGSLSGPFWSLSGRRGCQVAALLVQIVRVFRGDNVMDPWSGRFIDWSATHVLVAVICVRMVILVEDVI